MVSHRRAVLIAATAASRQDGRRCDHHRSHHRVNKGGSRSREQATLLVRLTRGYTLLPGPLSRRQPRAVQFHTQVELTVVAEVVDEDDLLDEVLRTAIEDTETESAEWRR